MNFKLLKLTPILLLLGCTTEQVVTNYAFPSSCLSGDKDCERNLNAQTLAYIGHKKAATELMCTDKDIRKVLEECGNNSEELSVSF